MLGHLLNLKLTISSRFQHLNVCGNSGGKKYEERSEEEVRGKGFGGGGATQVNYNYFADIAITLCEGPIEGIRRIWMNNKIWWTAADDASDDADVKR